VTRVHTFLLAYMVVSTNANAPICSWQLFSHIGTAIKTSFCRTFVSNKFLKFFWINFFFELIFFVDVFDNRARKETILRHRRRLKVGIRRFLPACSRGSGIFRGIVGRISTYGASAAWAVCEVTHLETENSVSEDQCVCSIRLRRSGAQQIFRQIFFREKKIVSTVVEKSKFCSSYIHWRGKPSDTKKHFFNITCDQFPILRLRFATPAL
jgi:hypothetical protein